MIGHDINPVLLQWGVLRIGYYNLVYILGLVVVYFWLKHAVKKGRLKGLDLDDYVFYLAIGLIAGARIFYFVFYSPSTFIDNPLDIFKLWHGGMSFHGGLIGIVLATWLYCRKSAFGFYQLADIVVIPAAIILFFGRIANFLNAELIGTFSNLPFCIEYQGVEGCRHPSQLYEAAKNLLIFFALLVVRRKKTLKPGTLFWLFVLLYGTLRFLLTLFREDPRFLGLSLGQYLSLAMVVVASVFLYRIKKAPTQ